MLINKGPDQQTYKGPSICQPIKDLVYINQ